MACAVATQVTNSANNSVPSPSMAPNDGERNTSIASHADAGSPRSRRRLNS